MLLNVYSNCLRLFVVDEAHTIKKVSLLFIYLFVCLLVFVCLFVDYFLFINYLFVYLFDQLIDCLLGLNKPLN